MSIFKSEAIFKLYPEANHTANGTPYDANGNAISYDDVAVSAEASSLEAKQKRLELLTQTDWWATSDRTMTAEQTAYRQALRDITAQAGFPTDITWPTKPE